MLNNRMDDLVIFYPKSDEGIFVGYSFTSKAYKAYRVDNKRNLCIDESVHVIVNDAGERKNLVHMDELELEKLMKIQRDSLVQDYGGKCS